MLLTVYLVCVLAVVFIMYLTLNFSTLNIKVTSTSLPCEKIHETLTIETESGAEEYIIETDAQSEVNKKTEKSLPAEEAIDYVQQHQQQFGKEEADRITESIAEISTRNQKIRWIRICVPIILVIIGIVAYIKTYFIESQEEQ